MAAEHKTYEEAKAGIDETLKKMGLDYLDMMIIHSPQPWVEVNQSENRYVEGNRAAWRALEEAYSEGKLKAIGVSNFQIGDLEALDGDRRDQTNGKSGTLSYQQHTIRTALISARKMILQLRHILRSHMVRS